MLVKTFNEYELQAEFKRFDRDYYSLDGYRAILDLFEECDNGTTELDVIAICCDFNEDEPSDIIDNYSNTLDTDSIINEDSNIDIDALMDELNYYTWAVLLNNGSILYQCF